MGNVGEHCADIPTVHAIEVDGDIYHTWIHVSNENKATINYVPEHLPHYLSS